MTTTFNCSYSENIMFYQYKGKGFCMHVFSSRPEHALIATGPYTATGP